MSILDLFKTRVREVQEATQTIRGNIGELRQAIVTKRAEIDQIRGAFPPRDELIASAEQQVDARGAYWWETHERAFLQGLAGNPVPGFDDKRRVQLPWSGDKSMSFDERCAFEPDQIKAWLREGIRTRCYEAGLPTAERPARLEQLARELADLETQEEQLVDQAAEAGVMIEHREEVKQRREQERRRREGAQRADEQQQRREREDVVDRRHERRVSHSEYLERH